MARRKRNKKRFFGIGFGGDGQYGLSAETKKNIISLLVFLAGLLGALSLFGAAGVVGQWIYPRMFSVFGWGAYVMPFILVAVSLARLDPDKFQFSRGRYIGGILFMLGVLGALHMFGSKDQGLILIDEGGGGGWIGWSASYWLRSAVGDIAAVATLVVVAGVGVMMVTDKTIGDCIRSWRDWRAARAANQEDEEEDEEGDEEDEEEKDTSTLPIFSTRLMGSVRDDKGTEEKSHQAGVMSAGRSYRRPPLSLLSDTTTQPASGDIKKTQQAIERTLETFGIPVSMRDVHVGPTVTQYTLKPDEGVKLSKITTLHNDLALALSAHPIRIEAPIPGKGLVGIELPNKAVAVVRLRELLAGKGFQKPSSSLMFAVGKDVTGSSVVDDLDTMPHLLIAGATGAGKSVMINNVIMSLLYRNGPQILRFLMIDPKRVELTLYDGVPHLVHPVISEPEKAIGGLRWVIGEMERRYTKLSETKRRDIRSYNSDKRGDDVIPYLVVVIDELADLMARYGREVEGAIVRLAQMSRAVGIHLVVATQRPSVDVVTGLIKANITSRMAFNVASLVDSRTILDMSGAEKLLGRGDMLYKRGDVSKPRRVQAAYVSEEEVKRVVEFLSRHGEPNYDPSVTAQIPARQDGGWGSEGTGGGDDELLEEAERVVREAKRASTSLLQRRLRIGYQRAARIIDMLEERGVVGPGDGPRPREVLTDDDQFSEPPEPMFEDDAGSDFEDEEAFDKKEDMP